jgi:dCTP diphosphatase
MSANQRQNICFGVDDVDGGQRLLKNDQNTVVKALIIEVREFLHERDWEKYHTPKDLAESICIEAAELLQLFQWIKPEESNQFKNDPSKINQIREELADVVIYCLSMANTLSLDLTKAVLNKIKQNKEKYPTDRYKGKAHLNQL